MTSVEELCTLNGSVLQNLSNKHSLSGAKDSGRYDPDFHFLNFRETVIRYIALGDDRGKSGHHRAGFPAKAGGACLKASSRPVPQKINRLTLEVRVKWWGKSPPPPEQSCGHGKPNPMQDEIGNRAARPMVSGTSHPRPRGIVPLHKGAIDE